MSKYGQYCPIAKSLEILGDRWTLLIIRDVLTGTRHFNDLERGLPGISRALLSRRLQHLQRAELLEKGVTGTGQRRTEYRLTHAGQELFAVLNSLRMWGETWAFGDPRPDELDPKLLMWWLRGRVERSRLPNRRIVTQFDFHGAATISFWLILTKDDVTVCLTDPGFEIQVLVTADLAAFYKLWGGRISYRDALNTDVVRIDGTPSLSHAFPQWFGWGNITPAKSNAPAVSRIVRS